MATTLYYAVDENGAAYLFTKKPERKSVGAQGVWMKPQAKAATGTTEGEDSGLMIPVSSTLMFEGFLPRITWADEPVEVSTSWSTGE